MKWNKPKKVITNITFYLSLITFIISIIAIIILTLWIKNPKIIDKLDYKIPNYYLDNITMLYKRAKTSKDIDIQLDYYQQLHVALAGISSLDRFYHTKQQTYKYLIRDYRKKQKYNDALSLAKEWVEQNDHDFEAKLWYADLLADISFSKANQYYNTLYAQHKDIIEIVKNYINFLIKNNDKEKALEIENDFNKRYSSLVNAKYKLYYLDKTNPKYSEQGSVPISNIKYIKNNMIHLDISKNFILLSAIRFDINGAPIGSTIKDLNITIEANNINYPNVHFKLAHHLKERNHASHQIVGTDPFYYIELPSILKLNSGTINFKISFTLENKLNAAYNAINVRR